MRRKNEVFVFKRNATLNGIPRIIYVLFPRILRSNGLEHTASRILWESNGDALQIKQDVRVIKGIRGYLKVV